MDTSDSAIQKARSGKDDGRTDRQAIVMTQGFKLHYEHSATKQQLCATVHLKNKAQEHYFVIIIINLNGKRRYR